MACNSEMQSQETAESSSDDECLATLKRKAGGNATDDNKVRKTDGDSDDEPLIPRVYVKVEIEELDEPENSCGYTSSNSRKAKTSRHRTEPGIRNKWKPTKRKKISCPDCEAEFHSVHELKTHSIQHQVETRHKCDECGRCFNKAFGLRTHKRMHGEKNFKCPLCDAAFTLKNNLGRHMAHHDRNFKCSECDATFHTQDKLDQHQCDIGQGSQSTGKMEVEQDPLETPASNIKITIRKTKELITSDNTFENTSTEANDVKTEANSDESMDEVNDSFETNDLDNSSEILKKDDLNYTIQCAIVSKMHKGRSVPDICEIYNLTPEVVNEIWEQRDEFVILKRAGRNSIKYMNKVLDSKILDWWNDKKNGKVQVTGKMLMDAAESFAKESGFISFNGSKKWLDRFKKRYNITFRTAPFKRNYHIIPSESKWKKIFLEEQWLDCRNGISDEDIYTADEIGLYYNSSRGRIKKLAGKKYIHGFAKDRLSILMCTNVSGSDKKKLLVCGTEDPLLHSYRNPDTLPVIYVRHGQAHFTTPMFEEFVKFWNRELKFQNRKVVLLLDRATIHSKLTLSNLKLVFVPWKTSTSLMPIKNGIFNRFRDEFRKLMLQEKSFSAIRGVDRNITCLEALNMLEKAWERTPSEIISKSFEDIGYDIGNNIEHKPIDVPKVTDNDEELICNMLKEYDVEPYFTDLPALDNYLTVDEEYLTGHGTNGSVFGGNHKKIDNEMHFREMVEILPLATERPDSDEIENSVIKSRTLQDLEIVRKYLQTNDTSYELFCKFMDVEKFLYKTPV